MGSHIYLPLEEWNFVIVIGQLWWEIWKKERLMFHDLFIVGLM